MSAEPLVEVSTSTDWTAWAVVELPDIWPDYQSYALIATGKEQYVRAEAARYVDENAYTRIEIKRTITSLVVESYPKREAAYV